MADKRSFGAVVWERFQDTIHNSVSEYVEENFASLGLRSHRVHTPTEACLGSLHYQRAIAYDTPGMAVKFDLVVSADIELCGVSHSQSVDDEKEQWFRLECEAELDNGLHDFTIRSIEIYDYADNRTRGVLTDTLVPVIATADLDKQAEIMLREVYPEALECPTKIDVREFARRLGLAVVERRLSRTATIFGEMIFSDCTIDCLDDDSRNYRRLNVEKGTILVDPEVHFLRTIGSRNNTVIHECVHWFKHRKVFELGRIFDPKISRIRCKVAESAADEQKRTDTEWMEFHANAIAPRVLMPFAQFKNKAGEVINKLKLARRTDCVGNVMADAIPVLAEFFDVSIQAAKIRMIDVGYTEAIGAYEYVDNHYVSAYSFGSRKIRKNQSFSVPTMDGIAQYAFNSDLRRIIDSGNFVSVDNHFVINDPKYVTENEYGGLDLTEYAVSHIDECCLVFDRTAKANTAYGAQRYTECALFQSAVARTVTTYEYSHTESNREIEERAAAMRRAELQDVKETAKLLGKLTQSFGESLSALMDRRGITVERLAEASYLSAKTIQRMRNDDDHIWKIEQVMAVCIGLKLPLYISDLLLKKAGLIFKSGEKHLIYQHLLAMHYNKPISEFNEYLNVAGFPPLTNNE